MRRLSRLARARISRVPDVGFGGATVSLAVCAEDLEFFVILPPQNARFSRLVPVTRIFLCGLAVCFLGRLEKGWRSELILRWDRLPGRADREISAVSGKIGRNFTGKFLKTF